MSETATLETPVKAPKAKKTVKKAAKPSANGHDKERAAAKDCGLTLVHYRILNCLRNGKEHTYRDIEAKTGYYSTLTAQLRDEHEGSLGALGMVRLAIHDIDGKDKITFTITAKGRKALTK